jgi:hypothetical protein
MVRTWALGESQEDQEREKKRAQTATNPQLESFARPARRAFLRLRVQSMARGTSAIHDSGAAAMSLRLEIQYQRYCIRNSSGTLRIRAYRNAERCAAALASFRVRRCASSG